MNSNTRKITVATVCLNAESTLRNTIDSVFAQDYENYEYLIVDGLSKDKTISIVNEYIPLFAEKHIDYRVVSEKDNGLYDAMNKAADLSNGEWIIYMNAGDTLLDRSVLKDVSVMLTDDINVLYGDILLADGGKYKLHKSGDIDLINRCFPVMHQSCLTRTVIMRKYRFDTSYKVSADYDFFLRLYKDDRASIRKTDYVMSTFLMGGLSTTAVVSREKDYNFARKKNGIKEPAFAKLHILAMTMKEYVRLFAIKLLKDDFFNSKRGYFSLEEIKEMLKV